METYLPSLVYVATLLRCVDSGITSFAGVDLRDIQLGIQLETALKPLIAGESKTLLSPFSFLGDQDFKGVIQRVPSKPEPGPQGRWGYPFDAKNPLKDEPVSQILADFKTDLAKITDFETGYKSILPLIHRYFAGVPKGAQGVTVYDYARITAALAHNEAVAGNLELLLVKGEVSGIQAFIFDVQSKGAAKSLKARSFRVQVLTKLAIEKIKADCGLEDGHVLYDGGGNFYLIAPAQKMDLLQEIRTQFADEMLNARDPLSLQLACNRITIEELVGTSSMASSWDNLAKKLNEDKLRPYAGLPFASVFRLEAPVNDSTRRVEEKNHYSDFAKLLMNAKGYSIRASNSKKFGGWYTRFGFEFLPEDEESAKVLFNETKVFGENSDIQDHSYSVYQMPVWRENLLNQHSRYLDLLLENDRKLESRQYPWIHDVDGFEGELIDFQMLSEFAKRRTGTQRLAIFKADVDGLGKVFSGGLAASRRSVFHVAALSRALKWFFEGRMNALLDAPVAQVKYEGNGLEEHDSGEKETFRDNIYTLFSGGDDFFIVGAWDLVLEFASYVQEEFAAYTHRKMTFSAGIVIAEEKSPVVRFSELADTAEAGAKRHPGKNAISIFGEVLSWNDFKEAKRMANVLIRFRIDLKEPAALIWKIRKVMEPLRDLQRAIVAKETIAAPRIWRLHQGLRTIKDKNQDEAKSELLDPIWRQLQTLYTDPKSARNVAYISVATRWAELMTRNLSENDE